MNQLGWNPILFQRIGNTYIAFSIWVLRGLLVNHQHQGLSDEISHHKLQGERSLAKWEGTLLNK